MLASYVCSWASEWAGSREGFERYIHERGQSSPRSREVLLHSALLQSNVKAYYCQFQAHWHTRGSWHCLDHTLSVSWPGPCMRCSLWLCSAASTCSSAIREVIRVSRAWQYQGYMPCSWSVSRLAFAWILIIIPSRNCRNCICRWKQLSLAGSLVTLTEQAAIRQSQRACQATH